MPRLSGLLHTGQRATLALAITWLLTGCGAHLAQREAREQWARADYEAALATLQAAERRYPEDIELRTSVLRARSEAAAKLVLAAQTAQLTGNVDEAERLLNRAAKLSPDSARAGELLQALATERRQAESLAKAEALAAGSPDAALAVVRDALKSNPRHAGLVALQRRLERAQRDQRNASAQKGLAETRPISLDFRDAPLRTVLDAVARHSNVGFVFDKDLRGDLRITVYLRNVKVEEALDLIVGTHQLAMKVLDERTVLIYPNTPEKQREHQEQVVKTFQLASGEAKQAAALLKSVLRAREPFVDERANLLVLRESPEIVQLAERLIALYDVGEPEVVLDLEVLEVSSTRINEIGIKFPDSISLTPLAAASGGLTVSSLRDLNSSRIGVSVAGILINLKRNVGDFETLANPNVRIRNREKGRVLVGSKLPIVTTTSTATGFVAESVNYVDVGLKLELEPTVFPDDDVAIRIGLEVSSLGNTIKTSSGSLAYEIHHAQRLDGASLARWGNASARRPGKP